MELKPGYKMTEVGVIPEDWEVKVLGDCSDIYRGGSPRPIEAYLTTSSNGYNWIKIGDVQQNEKFIYRTEEKIIKEGVTRSRFVHKGDFLLSNSMSFGRPYILKIDGCIHDGWLVIQNYQPFFDSNFLYYLLCSEYILKQYKTKAAGSGVLNLNKELVSSIKIICPTIKEQQAIAAALSDVDELLSSLDQLIAKKKNIRLAAMHELLTGKTRLPGFQEKWREKSVDEVSVLGHKRIVPSKTPHCHMCIELEHIVPKTGKLCGFSDGKFISSIKSFFDEQSILFGKLRAYLQKFWYAKCSGACSTEIWVLNAKRNIVIPKFLYYAIQTKEFIEASSITYGTHMPRSDWNMVKDVILSLPPSLAEQQAIASVLSDMDAEIEELEARRDKVRHIKAGMMQELLTGKTRLISSGEEA